MVHLAYFVLAFAILQLIVATLNIIFIQKFKNNYNENELISVLIPARNEEKNIGNILKDLLNQPYKNLEIIVFNDQSTDTTSQIVENYQKIDNRIKIINSTNLPDGWRGKNFACYQLAKNANGKFFLFLDADVRIFNNIIPLSVRYLKQKKLKMLSIFPKQQMLSFGEKITVPLMNYILLTLLPLFLVKISKFSSLAAANGQFILFDAQTYKNLQPHLNLKNKTVEDIQIARLYKKQKQKIACLVGKKDIQCRMYTSYIEAIEGFSRSISSFFGNSLILATFFWFVTTFGFLFIIISLTPIYLFFYIFIVLITKIFVSLASNQNILQNILYFPINQFVIAIVIIKAFTNKLNKNFQWKGRKIEKL